MSLNAVSKHIKVLEAAGLASRVTTWREHLIAADMAPITEMDRWFQDLRSIWDQRLELLDDLITKGTAMTSELSLTSRRNIKAAPKAIYDAWLDPIMLAKFMLAGPGMSVPEAATDPRVNGRFAIVMRMGENDLPHGGTYLELEPHKRIVFTWESPFSAEGSTVTIDLSPVAGGTDVVLTHVKFATAESRDNHAKGWGMILDNLDTILASK